MATLLTTLIKIGNKIQARHIFGIGLIILAIGIVLRPFGTVVVIANSYGISPTAYAALIAISGTTLTMFNPHWLIRWLATAPFVLYLAGTIELTASSPTRPYTVIILYLILYTMTLFFMKNESQS